MTDEQYKKLMAELAIVRDNQRVINQNIAQAKNEVLAKISDLQSDMQVSIGNDHISEDYFKRIEQELLRLKLMLNK